MPEQQGRRANAVTASNFEAPFETPIRRFGRRGLNLLDSADTLHAEEARILTNIVHEAHGEMTSREGLTQVVDGPNGEVHTIRRFYDPQSGSATRLVGIGTTLYRGTSSLSSIDGGYSGDPLTLVPYHPPQSDDPWMFVADENKMRQVRFDGLDLPIGLAAPGAAPVAILGGWDRLGIAAFDPTYYDAAYSGGNETWGQFWTPNKGFDYSDPSLPTEIPLTHTDSGTFTTVPGDTVATAQNGHNSWWNLPKTMNLSTFGTGRPAVTDDDLMHLWLKFSHPQLTAEVRLYLVCSETFSTSALPGLGLGNADYYVKVIRPGDWSGFVAGLESAQLANERARLTGIKNDALREISFVRKGPFGINSEIIRGGALAEEQDDAERSIAGDAGDGAADFREFGIIGRPFRRGDWKRHGSTVGRDWSTITGIVIYLQATKGASGPIEVTLIDWYLHGGSGPDTTTPGLQKYDYRIRHRHTITGDVSNPSPEMAETAFIDAQRRTVILQIGAPPASCVHEVYRRGGGNVDDWNYVGETDQIEYFDGDTDAEAIAGDTLELDNDRPITSVDDAGDPVENQPLPVLFGPLEDRLFGLGDPYRPGHVYWCKRTRSGSWPPGNHVEVCAAGEELLTGCIYGGEGFAFSRSRGYVLMPSTTQSDGVTSAPSGCLRGPVNRWAFAVNRRGMFFVANDGVYLTSRGPEEEVSRNLRPLFNGKTVGPYAPIDLTSGLIRLTCHGDDLYFLYEDTEGETITMVLDTGADAGWRAATYPVGLSVWASDEGATPPLLLAGGRTNGTVYSASGTSDAGTAIAAELKTGAWDAGRPREEKLFGDQFLDLDPKGADVTVQNFVNDETITNPEQAIDPFTGKQRIIFDPFGEEPQRGKTITTRVAWETASDPPIVYQQGVSITLQPELTIKRVTNWDDLGHSDEKWVSGIWIDCDTGGGTIEVLVERDFNGERTTIQSLTINHVGRHKKSYSWPAVPANMVRLRPITDCGIWLLYRTDWIRHDEPPRIAKWDVHFENGWDNYYTGLDLYCDTGGLDKTVLVYVDEVLIGTYTINTNGRKVQHLTLPWGRGHVFRFKATDDNPGLLYDHRWHLQAEPSEQANWNQNFVTPGHMDKWLKYVTLECDTYGVDKTITLEVDGVVGHTQTVNTNGRRVVQFAFPKIRGRMFRLFPTDQNPGRLYTLAWGFDQEPLALTRWETQELTYGIEGFVAELDAQLVLRSTAPVTLTLLKQVNHNGDTRTEPYTIPSTLGYKQGRYLTFRPAKGVLATWLFTSTEPFYLYREESWVRLNVWGEAQPRTVRPFGNDDLDPARVMTNATLSATRTGGAAEA